MPPETALFLPGDVATTECIYDTTGRANRTRFGEGTLNESESCDGAAYPRPAPTAHSVEFTHAAAVAVCFAFLAFYPKLPTIDVCITGGNQSVVPLFSSECWTRCGGHAACHTQARPADADAPLLRDAARAACTALSNFTSAGDLVSSTLVSPRSHCAPQTVKRAWCPAPPSIMPPPCRACCANANAEHDAIHLQRLAGLEPDRGRHALRLHAVRLDWKRVPGPAGGRQGAAGLQRDRQQRDGHQRSRALDAETAPRCEAAAVAALSLR